MAKPLAAIIWENCESWTADHAHVAERDTFTGLYDQNGAPLHRQPERIGFDPHRWDAKPTGKKR